MVEETAGVSEEMAEGHGFGVVPVPTQDLDKFLRQVLRDRIVKTEPPLFPEAENGSGNIGLCVAGDPHGVGRGHGLSRRRVGLAGGALPVDPERDRIDVEGNAVDCVVPRHGVVDDLLHGLLEGSFRRSCGLAGDGTASARDTDNLLRSHRTLRGEST